MAHTKTDNPLEEALLRTMAALKDHMNCAEKRRQLGQAAPYWETDAGMDAEIYLSAQQAHADFVATWQTEGGAK